MKYVQVQNHKIQDSIASSAMKLEFQATDPVRAHQCFLCLLLSWTAVPYHNQ